MNNRKDFALSPVGANAKLFFAGLILLPVILIAVIWWNNPSEFSDIPLWALGLMFGIGPAMLVAAAMGVRNPQAELGMDGLSLKVSFIDKRWALNDIDRVNAALVNLESRQELRPKWKLLSAYPKRSGFIKLGATEGIPRRPAGPVMLIPAEYRLINGNRLDAVPACLYRARANSHARQLARADWLIRERDSGNFIATMQGSRVHFMNRSPAPQQWLDAVSELLASADSGFAFLPLSGLNPLLDELGIDAEIYGRQTGLSAVAEPVQLEYAGRDCFRRPLWLAYDAAKAWERALPDGDFPSQKRPRHCLA